MGQAADGVTSGTPGRDPDQLAGRVEALRGELGELLDELQRRRREAFDLGLQLRRHPVAAAASAAAAAAAIGGALAFAFRPKRRPLDRARRRSAPGRLLDRHAGAPRASRLGRRVFAAAGAVAASVLLKRLLVRTVKSTARAAAAGAMEPIPVLSQTSPGP